VSGVRVGPFVLDDEIGGGGMGSVWGGRHADQGVAVAVKLLHARFAETPWFLESFAKEVRAVARLRHPAIVDVFDHGRIDAETAAASGGVLEPGSPWLAMERVPGRPLSRLCGRIDWSETKRVLLGLLDALAHAHARGVVHRDIKPGNAMASADRVVLVDFGLAHPLNRALDPGEIGQVVGTAAYMAPEQFRGDDAAFGPWTDLYSVGCLAWALVGGAPPFGRRGTFTELQTAHLGGTLPGLEPLRPVPQGLEQWLRTLLEKAPERRFARAAEAAWALQDLGPPITMSASVMSTFGWAQEETRTAPAVAAMARLPAGPAAVSHARPPLPASWRLGAQARRSIRLTGAGLRLFGLRSLPLVGREAERDALWASLGEVVAGGTRAAVLHGLAGAGKSALASWLCERSHELGHGDVLSVRHGEVVGPADGLGAGLARWLRCAGLEGPAREDRLARAVAAMGGDEADRRAALALTDPRGGGFPSAHARHAALLRLVSRASLLRPVVLRIEDVQWGTDALAFALHALARPAAGAGVLLLLTSREVPEGAVAARLLDRLLSLPGARRVEVGPLPPGRRTRLIGELLHLEGDLAQAVEERTAGNPLFMVQLVGDWVQRGVLVPGERGFQLRDGVTAELPDDLHAVWQGRVSRALADRGPLEVKAAQLAAILGMTVDREEWRSACRAVGAWASTELVEDLLAAGLAQPDPRGAVAGWSFVHGMLRESLVKQAEADGWARTARQGCVEMLREQRGRDGRTALRLGRQLFALGEHAEAADQLSSGAWASVRASEYLAAEVALVEREAALDALGEADGRERVRGWIMRARVARRRGHPDEAAAWTARATSLASGAGWSDLSCQAQREEARLAAWKGDRRGALRHLARALGAALRADDVLAAAWVRRDQALARLEGGAPHAMIEPPLAAAQAVFEAEGEVFGAATCLLGRAVAGRRAGRDPQSLLDAASATLRRSLSVQEPAHAWACLGQVAFERGDVGPASERFERARERFDEIGHPGPDALPLLAARAQIRRGAAPAAAAALRLRLQGLLDQGRPLRLPGIYGHLALALVAAGRMKEAARLVASAQAEADRAGQPDADLVEVSHALALRAERAGDAALADRARQLAAAVSWS
jgi:eukaryotic-like serine/threonine-protein kinase